MKLMDAYKTNALTRLNGRNLYYFFLAGAKNLLDHQAEINKINVFPVPDADTGTNLASTIRSITTISFPDSLLIFSAAVMAFFTVPLK